MEKCWVRCFASWSWGRVTTGLVQLAQVGAWLEAPGWGQHHAPQGCGEPQTHRRIGSLAYWNQSGPGNTLHVKGPWGGILTPDSISESAVGGDYVVTYGYTRHQGILHSLGSIFFGSESHVEQPHKRILSFRSLLVRPRNAARCSQTWSKGTLARHLPL